MKKAVSVCAGVMIFFFSLGIFCTCSFGGMDSGTFHTVNFQYSVGNGEFDYTAQIKDGYELDEPYDEDLAEDYYIIWTINDSVVSFPVTINGDCTLVGNAFPYDNAEEVSFLGNADETIVTTYIKENWERHTIGNIETDDEDFVYYSYRHGVSAEYNDVQFFPSTRQMIWSKTRMNNLSLGNGFVHYEYTTQIKATIGETMDKAAFQAVYAAESVNSQIEIIGGFDAVFTYQIDKVSAGFMLKQFPGIKYNCSMSNITDKFDKEDFAETLYIQMQDSMLFLHNQLQKINPDYSVFTKAI